MKISNKKSLAVKMGYICLGLAVISGLFAIWLPYKTPNQFIYTGIIFLGLSAIIGVIHEGS